MRPMTKDQGGSEKQDFHPGQKHVVQEKGKGKSNEDRHTAEERGRLIMDLAPVRPVKDLKLKGQSAAERGQETGRQK